MQIEHIVAGGCSFSEDGIGGVPPDHNNPSGGCSFTNSDGHVSNARSWISKIAEKTNCQSLVNLATSGHGNILTSMAIIDVLSNYTTYQHQKESVMVLFNLTELMRLDIPCHHDHPDKSAVIPWNQSILPYAFLEPTGGIRSTIIKNIGLEQAEIMSMHAILALFNYLEQNKFNYRYTIMKSYQGTRIADILSGYRKNFVELPGDGSMENYCVSNKLTISDTDTHPNHLGHSRIAEFAIDTF